MRVREVWANDLFDACSEYEFGETEDYNINIIRSGGRKIYLTVFPEGLWNGTSLNKAKNETGDQYPGNVADKITIEFHNAFNYEDIAYSVENVNLTTSGNVSFFIPQALSGNYYLTVKHRNSIETVSASPVLLSSGLTSYNFSSSADAAFGNNLILLNGKYCIFGGDVNQDGIVDSGDMIPVDNLASNFGTGYLSEDANGDGLIDSGDMIMVDNNSSGFIGKITP
jgi:hypothetical protein